MSPQAREKDPSATIARASFRQSHQKIVYATATADCSPGRKLTSRTSNERVGANHLTSQAGQVKCSRAGPFTSLVVGITQTAGRYKCGANCAPPVYFRRFLALDPTENEKPMTKIRFKPNSGRFAPKLLAIIALTACLLGAGSVQAAGDAEAGKIKAYTCTGCHGIPGYNNAYPTYHVPKLGGQHRAYIIAALKAYRDGQRDHQTMEAQAASLSDQDIEDIAAYFAGLASHQGGSGDE